MSKEENDLVAKHRQATLLSGNISDFQITNLKTWPFILFGDHGLERVELQYDFTKSPEGYENEEEAILNAGDITFDLYFKESPKLTKEDRDSKIKHLNLWTKFLFWNDTQVKVHRNGKKWV